MGVSVLNITIKIKLPERVKQSDESDYVLVRYEGKKIIIEFLKTTKAEQASKLDGWTTKDSIYIS